jgi:hypothetical protein
LPSDLAYELEPVPRLVPGRRLEIAESLSEAGGRMVFAKYRA